MGQIISGKIISSDKNKYSRIKIYKKDLGLFGQIKKITVVYNGVSLERELNHTFRKYGEINSIKIREWFSNKKSDIDIDISEINSKKIKIIKINN